MLERVFDSFYTTKPTGFGLGLSICRSIIEAHGGHVWATANAPRGAIFQFTLPRAPDAFAKPRRPRPAVVSSRATRQHCSWSLGDTSDARHDSPRLHESPARSPSTSGRRRGVGPRRCCCSPARRHLRHRLSYLRGAASLIDYPRVMGHELSGVVAEAPASSRLARDQVVTVNPCSCGTCIACRKGKPNCCMAISVLGVHRDGGMCEWLCLPEGNLFRRMGSPWMPPRRWSFSPSAPMRSAVPAWARARGCWWWAPAPSGWGRPSSPGSPAPVSP